MNDFFTEETAADQTMSPAETQEIRDKIQAEVFEGTPAKFDDPIEEPTTEPTPNDSESVPVEPVVDPPTDPPTDPAPSPLPPEMQAIVDSVNKLTGSISGMEDRVRKTEGRIGNLTHEFSVAREAAATQAKAPTPIEMAEAAKTEEAWGDLKKDFPSWATAIEGKISTQTSQYVSVDDFEALRQSVKQTPTVDPNQLETRLVGLFHPDYKEIVADPTYATWLNSQPGDVQHKAFNGKTAEEAIDVFNRFKESKRIPTPAEAPTEVAKIKAQQAARLAASTTANTNHKTIKQKTEADMTEAELREHIANKVFT